ncbi:ArsR/SmtB family transcription factor [Patescibacteria group bacterium]
MQLDPECADCFAGLSCGIRVEIIKLLMEHGKMSVSSIAKHFKVTQPTITHHLTYLKKVGILTSKKKGRYNYYLLDPKCKDNCELFTQTI